MNMTSGRHVGVVRRMLGLTQRELAEVLGVNQSSVCRWERGDTAPPREVWRRLLALPKREANATDWRIALSVRRHTGCASLHTVDMTIVEASPALTSLQGIERNQLLGLNSRRRFTPTLHEAYDLAIEGGLLSCDVLGVDIRSGMKLVDGSSVSLESNWTVLNASDGTPLLLWQARLVPEAHLDPGVDLIQMDDLVSGREDINPDIAAREVRGPRITSDPPASGS